MLQRSRRYRKKIALWKKITLGVLCLVILASGYTIYRLQASFDKATIDTSTSLIPDDEHVNYADSPSTPENAPDSNLPIDEVVRKPSEDFYAMVIGLDMRDHLFTLNTDSLLVVHFIPQSRMIKLISLPRDTRVINAEGEPTKINGLFAEGYMTAKDKATKNPELLSGKKVSLGRNKIAEEYISSGIVRLRQSIEQLLDLHIDHSFIVTFQTVIELVDAVGGVDINVDRSMQWDDSVDDTHIHLEPGMQRLNGQQALDYSRFRQDNRGESFYSNDFERGERQQKVIAELMDKIVSFGNITKILSLIDITANNVKTDMDTKTMLRLAQKYYGNLDAGSVKSLHFNGYWESPYVYISDADLEALKRNFKDTEEVTPQNQSITSVHSAERSHSDM